MFIEDLKKEVGQEIKIAADLLKKGSPQGYEHLRNTLAHALFFAREDKSIFFLQHMLGPMRQDVITTIGVNNKGSLVEIGEKLDSIVEALNKDDADTIVTLVFEIGLIVEQQWRSALTSPSAKINKPIFMLGHE